MICLDIETTGLDLKNDRMVSIGAVRYGVSAFYSRINPEGRVSCDRAFRLHGLTDLESEPTWQDKVASQFLEWISDESVVLCGHNILRFDLPFLEREWARAGYTLSDIKSEGCVLSMQIVDTLVLARKRFPKQKNDLRSVYERMFKETFRGVYHNALDDAAACARIADRFNEFTTCGFKYLHQGKNEK